jgi:hypothetical protein
MENGRAALVLFFGLFWGFGLSMVHPYHLFDLPDLFNSARRKYALRRFLIGLLMVNFAPIGLLWALYTIVVPDRPGGLAVVSAAVSSLSIFGLLWVLHALVASDRVRATFYPEDEYEIVAAEWVRRGSNSFVGHFVPGVLYLVAFPALGYFIGQFAQQT